MSDLGWGAAIGAAITAAIAGLFAWLVQHRKSGADVEIAAIAEWQKLYDALSNRLSAVEKEFAEYRVSMAQDIEEMIARHTEQMDDMRKRHRAELDDIRNKHRAEMKVLRELNEGLQRQILQNSQSAAHLMGETPVTKAKDPGNGE